MYVTLNRLPITAVKLHEFSSCNELATSVQQFFAGQDSCGKLCILTLHNFVHRFIGNPV